MAEKNLRLPVRPRSFDQPEYRYNNPAGARKSIEQIVEMPLFFRGRLGDSLPSHNPRLHAALLVLNATLRGHPVGFKRAPLMFERYTLETIEVDGSVAFSFPVLPARREGL